MTAEQIRSMIETLAESQGSYGGLLRDIDEDPSILEELERICRENNIKDIVDLIMYIEGA